MPLRDYLVGLAYFVPTIGASALAALLVAGRRYRHLEGAQAVLAYAVLLTLAVIAAHLVPLAFGVLTRASILLTAILLAALAWLVPPSAPDRDEPTEPLPASGRISTALAALGVASASIYVLARIRFLAPIPLTDIDVLNFHLPGVARWIQSGSLWQIDQLFPRFVTGNYPNDGDVVTLAAVLPWRDAAFARLVPVPFIALTGVAVYALAAELRAARATAALFGAAAVMAPALAGYAVEGLPDAIMLFAFATGVLFLLRHARTRRTSDLALAGLALGIAFGTKWYGVTSVVAVLVVWAAIALLTRRRLVEVVRWGAALVGLILAAGGIWLVRNLVESGNPIFPQPIEAFGLTLFPGTEGLVLDRVGYTIAGYLGDPDVLGEFVLPGLWRQLGLLGPLSAIGLAIAGFLSVRALIRGEGKSGVPMLGVSVVVALICVLYAITPGSAFGEEGEPVQAFTTVRWLMPAVVLAAALAAAAATRLGRARIGFEIVALAAVADGIRRAADVELSLLVEVTIVLAALAALGWLVYRRRETLRRALTRRPLVAAAAAGAAAIALLAVAGRFDQERFAEHGYSSADPTIAWIEDNAPGGRRVGLAGTWDPNGISPAFPSFGPRMRNEVVYVGPWIDELLREYRSAGEFTAALERGDYDLLMVGRGQPPKPRAREERWASDAGFRPLAESDRLALYRAPPGGDAGPGAPSEIGYDLEPW